MAKKIIDSDELIAEIEKILAKAKNDEVKAFAKKDAAGHLIAVTKTAICVKIKKLIASLQQEQPEVELEKEIQRFLSNATAMNKGEWKNKYPISDMGFRAVARHFYELGLNARKEE